MRRILRMLTFATIALTMGCATPYGGSHLITAEVDLLPVPGFTLSRPDLVDKQKGVLVHGQICANGWPPFTRTHVLAQHLAANGSIIEQLEAYVYGMPDVSSSGCGYYAAETGWRLAPQDIIRIGPVLAK